MDTIYTIRGVNSGYFYVSKSNRRKAKKRKVSRKAISKQKVRAFISNASSSEIIQSQNLNLEALATISLPQVKYLHLMYEDGQLSDESVHLISEYIENFPRKESHLSELDNDNVDDCDSEDDVDDDDVVDNNDGDSGDNDDVDDNNNDVDG